jgi:hypothetical protein
MSKGMEVYTLFDTMFIVICFGFSSISQFNPLNAELNRICHLLALLGGSTIVVVSRLRVNTFHTVVL